jgi:hypothetical protein
MSNVLCTTIYTKFAVYREATAEKDIVVMTEKDIAQL